MVDSDGSRSAPTIRFEGGVKPLVAFFVGSSVYFTLVVLLVDSLIGDGSIPLWGQFVYYVVGFGPVALFAWVALRREGLAPSNVGLSWRNVGPGVLAVAGVWVLANVLGFVLATATGDSVSVGFPPGVALATWLVLLVSQLAIVGIVEEFAFRGYFQNKLVSLFDGGANWKRKVAAIVVATILFVLLHVPQRLVITGLSFADLPPALVGLFVYALLFAVIYELTRNVVFAGVLHGTFNVQTVLVFREGGVAVPEVGSIAVLLALVAVWLYRRWAKVTRPDDFSAQTGPSVVAADGGQ
ncbi:lysostaphin resistance A-like protein [Haloferax sp. YSMS24]|uniref:CPBP family intramembrane glutamic endopeptidase n=1 Tax=Haloferax sp. YSMS24 TaxID=3388425 RepID=UPI00398D091F